MIKALFFDMDDTLCDTRRANALAAAALAQALCARHLSLDAGTAQVFAADYLLGVYRDPSAGLEHLSVEFPPSQEPLYRQAVLQALIERHEIDEAGPEFTQELFTLFESSRMQAYDLFDGVADMLAQLRLRYQLVLITNGPRFSQAPKIARTGLAERLDHILIGGDFPKEKPDGGIFRHALALVGAQPHEVIHTGDSMSADIQGAAALGIPAFWVRNQQHINCHPAQAPVTMELGGIHQFMDALDMFLGKPGAAR